MTDGTDSGMPGSGLKDLCGQSYSPEGHTSDDHATFFSPEGDIRAAGAVRPRMGYV